MKNVSLRKAAKIRSKLDQLIAKQVALASTVTLSIDASDADILAQLDKQNGIRATALTELRTLLSLRQAIRAAIGRANAVNGLSDILAEVASNAALLAIYQSYYRRDANSVRPTDEQITARVATRRAQLASENVRYGGNEAMSFYVVTPAEMDTIEAEVESLTARNEQLVDMLEALNTTVEIALDDAIEASLTSVGISF